MIRIKPILLALCLLLFTGSSLFSGTICHCGSNPQSYWCAGVGTSCSQAQSNFWNHCDNQAESACVYGVCSLDMDPPNSCTTYPSDPGNYYFLGNVTYSCYVCIDYPD